MTGMDLTGQIRFAARVVKSEHPEIDEHKFDLICLSILFICYNEYFFTETDLNMLRDEMLAREDRRVHEPIIETIEFLREHITSQEVLVC